MAVLIKTDGNRSAIFPKSGKKKFAIDELRGYVGGYVRPLYLGKKAVMLVFEDAQMVGQAVNQAASEIAGQVIAGDVVLCEKGQF